MIGDYRMEIYVKEHKPFTPGPWFAAGQRPVIDCPLTRNGPSSAADDRDSS